MSRILDFMQEVISTGLANPSEFIGCSQTDLSKLEQTMGIKLPQVYRDFSTTMGRGAGSLHKGTDFLYESLFHLKDDFAYVLREDNCSHFLQPDVFVFSAHQGVIYHFFYTWADDQDPAVYAYLEGDRKTKYINSSFSGFLSQGLKEEKVIIERTSGL